MSFESSDLVETGTPLFVRLEDSADAGNSDGSGESDESSTRKEDVEDSGSADDDDAESEESSDPKESETTDDSSVAKRSEIPRETSGEEARVNYILAIGASRICRWSCKKIGSICRH